MPDQQYDEMPGTRTKGGKDGFFSKRNYLLRVEPTDIRDTNTTWNNTHALHCSGPITKTLRAGQERLRRPLTLQTTHIL